MKKLYTSNEVRRSFLDFFKHKGYDVIPRASLLVNDEDPSLLFVNAGMAPLKAYFCGTRQPPSSRLASAQPCVRISGKHDDIENVGRTSRHHTLFEMLGNFVFNGHSTRELKVEAATLAHEFLTRYMHLNSNRLYVSVHEEDDEAYDIWHRLVGVPEQRLRRAGDDENFWRLGAAAAGARRGLPCGPCSEIFYLRGDTDDTSTLSTRDVYDMDGDRLVEVWNLVFMQFEEIAQEPRRRLPSPALDTGMGLERLCSIVQGKENNFDTDALAPIVDVARRSIGGDEVDDDGGGATATALVSSRIVADHLRAAMFLIADGTLPSNAGAGYVLRRLVRRAVAAAAEAQRWPRPLPLAPRWLADVVAAARHSAGLAYPELNDPIIVDVIERTLLMEFNVFSSVLEDARRHFEAAVAAGAVVDAALAFSLHSSHGLPIDATRSIARSNRWKDEINEEELKRLMEEDRRRSRLATSVAAGASSSSSSSSSNSIIAPFPPPSNLSVDFTGYNSTSEKRSRVLYVRVGGGGNGNDDGDENLRARVVVSPSPFYAAAGGQVGDVGRLYLYRNEQLLAEYEVETTSLEAVGGGVGDGDDGGARLVSSLHVRAKKTEDIGALVDAANASASSPSSSSSSSSSSMGYEIACKVDEQHRRACSIHHTATHLLHAALRRWSIASSSSSASLLQQAGSHVDARRLRFDFSCHHSLTPSTLKEIEAQVNEWALRGYAVRTREMDYNEAVERGALAFFKDRYGSRVRVVEVGNFISSHSPSPSSSFSSSSTSSDDICSIELCGGTHVQSISSLYPFRILKEQSVAAGTRRIVAVAGAAAVAAYDDDVRRLQDVERVTRAPKGEVVEHVTRIMRDRKAMRKELKQLLQAQSRKK